MNGGDVTITVSRTTLAKEFVTLVKEFNDEGEILGYADQVMSERDARYLARIVWGRLHEKAQKARHRKRRRQDAVNAIATDRLSDSLA